MALSRYTTHSFTKANHYNKDNFDLAHFFTSNRLRSFLLRVSRTAPSNLMRSSGVCGLNLIVTCLNLYTLGNTVIQEPERYNSKQTRHMKTCEKNSAVAGLQYGWLDMEFNISIWYFLITYMILFQYAVYQSTK